MKTIYNLRDNIQARFKYHRNPLINHFNYNPFFSHDEIHYFKFEDKTTAVSKETRYKYFDDKDKDPKAPLRVLLDKESTIEYYN